MLVAEGAADGFLFLHHGACSAQRSIPLCAETLAYRSVSVLMVAFKSRNQACADPLESTIRITEKLRGTLSAARSASASLSPSSPPPTTGSRTASHPHSPPERHARAGTHRRHRVIVQPDD